MQGLRRLLEGQRWQNAFARLWPKDYRGRVRAMVSNFVLHLHPVVIRQHALRLRYTWCMGGLAAFLFLVETITGVLLMFYYRPTPEAAYRDVLDLTEVIALGVMRELHRWAGHAMVVVVMLHMLRVFLTGSYKPPREFNWVLGVGLLVLTFLLSFTGYLLPWDQLAFWAVTVGSDMAGHAPVVGAEGPVSTTAGGAIDLRFLLLGAPRVGGETLLRFYVWHCVGLPLAAAALMAWHFWRVRKDGFSGPL